MAIVRWPVSKDTQTGFWKGRRRLCCWSPPRVHRCQHLEATWQPACWGWGHCFTLVIWDILRLSFQRKVHLLDPLSIFCMFCQCTVYTCVTLLLIVLECSWHVSWLLHMLHVPSNFPHSQVVNDALCPQASHRQLSLKPRVLVFHPRPGLWLPCRDQPEPRSKPTSQQGLLGDHEICQPESENCTGQNWRLREVPGLITSLNQQVAAAALCSSLSHVHHRLGSPHVLNGYTASALLSIPTVVALAACPKWCGLMSTA